MAKIAMTSDKKIMVLNEGVEGIPSITVDSELSDTSTNPVQNKVIKAAIDAVDTKVENKQDKIGVSGLLKGDGTTISQAVAGTDYVVPSTALEEVPGHIANTNNPHGVTAAQAGAIASTEKGAANGVATLGADSKVPTEQLPEISAVKTFTATIGTTWTKNENTGVKSQNVSIPGVLAKHTAKVDHAYTGDGTSDGYAAFVEAENQYLTYITNGYAETYDGGITFYIFGDAPTVEIPIVVEVV